MARNYFVQDPLSRAYGIEAPTLGAGSDLIPQQKQTREAPAASSPRQFFESLAGETGVPPNVLFAVGEQTAKDGAIDQDAVRRVAQDIASAMAESDDPAEAVRRVGGENLLERSYQIASTVYPTEEDKEREKERNSHSFAGDLARKTFGGLISGTGRAAEGLGAFIAGPEEPETDHPLQAVRDVVNAPTRLVGEGISGVGRAISGYGDDISRNVSDEFAARMADSTPSGELFKPGTWSLGEDPTLAGYAAQGAQLFGEFAPVLISGYLTGGLGAAATGGAQALDAARDDADQTIRDLAVSGQIKEMPIYKELTDKGVSHQEAVDQIANMAPITPGSSRA